MRRKRFLAVGLAVMSLFVARTVTRAQSWDFDKTTRCLIPAPLEKGDVPQPQSHPAYQTVQSTDGERSAGGPGGTFDVDLFTLLPRTEILTAQPRSPESRIVWDETLHALTPVPVVTSLSYRGPGRAGKVLWDTSHGVYSSDSSHAPSGNFSSLAKILTGQGFTIDESSAGVLHVNLDDYAILVVCLGSAWDSPYDAAEVTAMEGFVQRGGGLLIMGDNPDCPNENIDPLTQTFCATCGISDIIPYDTYVTGFATHAVFDGVSELYLRAAGAIEASPPATEIAWYQGDGLVACLEVGAGKVLIVGDISIWTNDYLDRSDNERFATNVFAWLMPESQTRRTGKVLWDTSHGVYFSDYAPSGRFSSLAEMLTGQGFTIDENNAGVLHVNLDDYAILVVCLGSAWDSPYGVGEVTAMEDFVQRGGGLLIMGDNPNCPNENINPLAQIFGVICGVSEIIPYDTYVTDFAPHPVFDGISELCLRAAGAIEAGPPATEIAWYKGDGVLACLEVGSGKVFLTGDIAIWSNDYFAQKDNARFATNVFNWLLPTR